MGLDLRPKCSKCNKLIDLTDMRAVGNGKFVCKSCFELKDPSFNPLNRQKKPEPFNYPKMKPVDHSAVEPIASKNNFFSQKEYVCDDCGFSFKRDALKKVIQCPFCGKNNLHQKVEEYAQQHLED